MPTLGRIGFDEQLCWAIFTMTSPAWRLIGPVGDDVELINPILMKNLGEIRRGVISNSRKNSRARSILYKMDPNASECGRDYDSHAFS